MVAQFAAETVAGHISQETNGVSQVANVEIKKLIQKSLDWLKTGWIGDFPHCMNDGRE